MIFVMKHMFYWRGVAGVPWGFGIRGWGVGAGQHIINPAAAGSTDTFGIIVFSGWMGSLAKKFLTPLPVLKIRFRKWSAACICVACAHVYICAAGFSPSVIFTCGVE
jgi:hypothetical protein